HRASEWLRKGILYVLLTAGGFTALVPLFWMISTSLKPAGAVFIFPPEWIPRRQVQETIDGEELPVYIADLPDGPRHVGRIAFVPGGAKVKLLDDPGRGDVLEVPTRRVLLELDGRRAVVQPAARMPAHQDALPVADVAAQLGGEAALDPVRRTWVFQLADHRLEGSVGKRIAALDEQPLRLTTEPFTEDGKLVLPAAVFRDVLGLQMTSEKLLTPVRRVDIRWENYRNAWSAIELEEPMFAWSIPYALVSKFGGGKWRIGPVRFGGLQIKEAFFAFYINSLLVAIVVTFGQVFTSSLAAYAFARLQFPGRDKVFLGYLATMMIPAVVTMIPVFILLRQLGWIDSYKALIFPAMFSAYGTFLLRQFFLTIPTDLEDAARIDGCGAFGIYWNVILPLSKPALATLTTFVFLGSWNNYMWPLIVINSTSKKTLPIALQSFQGLYTTEWTLLMAASLLVLLPVLIVFIFNQRFFVRGIVLTGLKA
ncbi:MAG: ABC transporter permease subunit, partial [Armatimonadota bacterium]